MTRLGSALRLLGMCVLCGAIVVSMIGCNVDGNADSNWTPPSTTARPVENYVTKEFVEKYIADHFTGCEYATIKKVLVDNAVAFGEWNDNAKLLSTEDNHVTFTCNKDGNFGISKKLAVDISQPVIIQFKAEFDGSLFGVHINAFDSNGKFLTAWRVDKGTKQYELSVSASETKEIVLIISAAGNETNIGEPISISELSVWQNEEKLSVVVGADHDTVAEIVDKANLTSSRFYAAPNGDRYQLQVTNEGELVMVPVIPSKSLFIGNSLLIGFGFGMAASDSQHDYYHLVNQAIYERNSDYVPSKLGGNLWENAKTPEEQKWFLNNILAPRLSEDLNLVVVQLGENVNSAEEIAVFAEGSREMLQFIRTKCPRARVVWVGAWYQTPEKMEAMKQACSDTGCTFININDLAKEKYKNAIGNTWTDVNGEQHTITTIDVATHPNDEGFRLIANRILYKLGIVDDENYYK